MGTGAQVFVVIALLLYFIPTVIAYNKHKKNAGAICALNVFLGWTFIGWVASLVWALTND